MMAKFEIKIDCREEEKARIINDSLKIDNESYIQSHVEGRYIIARGESKDMLSILNTINDFLSCLTLSKTLVNRRDGI
ncbi:MAG: hypothetical protein J7K61_02415 [Thermoplasmata archaeon]|nr:hypothetical protein [Thermoplasmata archaeon]